MHRRTTIPCLHLYYLHDEIELFAADGDEPKLSRKLLPIVRQLGQPVTPHRSPHREVDTELREHRCPLRREASTGQVSDGDVDVVHHLVVQVVLGWSPATPGTNQLLQQRLDGLCDAGDKERFESCSCAGQTQVKNVMSDGGEPCTLATAAVRLLADPAYMSLDWIFDKDTVRYRYGQWDSDATEECECVQYAWLCSTPTQNQITHKLVAEPMMGNIVCMRMNSNLGRRTFASMPSTFICCTSSPVAQIALFTRLLGSCGSKLLITCDNRFGSWWVWVPGFDTVDESR